MFAVEIYAAVRRFVFVEGKSRREAARVNLTGAKIKGQLDLSGANTLPVPRPCQRRAGGSCLYSAYAKPKPQAVE
jgi:hypothetical protein